MPPAEKMEFPYFGVTNVFFVLLLMPAPFSGYRIMLQHSRPVSLTPEFTLSFVAHHSVEIIHVGIQTLSCTGQLSSLEAPRSMRTILNFLVFPLPFTVTFLARICWVLLVNHVPHSKFMFCRVKLQYPRKWMFLEIETLMRWLKSIEFYTSVRPSNIIGIYVRRERG